MALEGGNGCYGAGWLKREQICRFGDEEGWIAAALLVLGELDAYTEVWLHEQWCYE